MYAMEGSRGGVFRKGRDDDSMWCAERRVDRSDKGRSKDNEMQGPKCRRSFCFSAIFAQPCAFLFLISALNIVSPLSKNQRQRAQFALFHWNRSHPSLQVAMQRSTQPLPSLSVPATQISHGRPLWSASIAASLPLLLALQRRPPGPLSSRQGLLQQTTARPRRRSMRRPI